jgi:hypothetical protein
MPKAEHTNGNRQAPINTPLVFSLSILLSQVSKMCLINKQKINKPKKLAVKINKAKEARPLKEISDMKQFFTV